MLHQLIRLVLSPYGENFSLAAFNLKEQDISRSNMSNLHDPDTLTMNKLVTTLPVRICLDLSHFLSRLFSNYVFVLKFVLT